MPNPSKGGRYYLVNGVHVPAEDYEAAEHQKIDATPAPDTGPTPDSPTETDAKE